MSLLDPNPVCRYDPAEDLETLTAAGALYGVSTSTGVEVWDCASASASAGEEEETTSTAQQNPASQVAPAPREAPAQQETPTSQPAPTPQQARAPVAESPDIQFLRSMLAEAGVSREIQDAVIAVQLSDPEAALASKARYSVARKVFFQIATELGIPATAQDAVKSIVLAYDVAKSLEQGDAAGAAEKVLLFAVAKRIPALSVATFISKALTVLDPANADFYIVFDGMTTLQAIDAMVRGDVDPTGAEYEMMHDVNEEIHRIPTPTEMLNPLQSVHFMMACTARAVDAVYDFFDTGRSASPADPDYIQTLATELPLIEAGIARLSESHSSIGGAFAQYYATRVLRYRVDSRDELYDALGTLTWFETLIADLHGRLLPPEYVDGLSSYQREIARELFGDSLLAAPGFPIPINSIQHINEVYRNQVDRCPESQCSSE